MESSPVFSAEEMRNTLETSASTGKFWLDWEKLKLVLSCYLKQVLSEYPEAKMTNEQQISALGETFPELSKRFDDALHCFDDGPPFTLQRLCEILLTAQSIYPKLSKLSLALEKNLLVTSTLTISTDPYPLPTKQDSNGSYEGSGNPKPQANSMENGIKPPVADKDEIMTDVPEAELVEDTTAKMETSEVVGSAEENPSPMVDNDS